MDGSERSAMPSPWDKVILDLGLCADEDIVAVAQFLWQYARPSTPSERIPVYAGLWPAVAGLHALLVASDAGTAASAAGLDRLATVLVARYAKETSARPLSTVAPVFAILAALYPAGGDSDVWATAPGWDAEHDALWTRLRRIIITRLLDPMLRRRPDDFSTGHLHRYAHLIRLLRNAWSACDPREIEGWLSLAAGTEQERAHGHSLFAKFVKPIRESCGRYRRGAKARTVYPELVRLVFLIFGRDAEEDGDGRSTTQKEGLHLLPTDAPQADQDASAGTDAVHPDASSPPPVTDVPRQDRVHTPTDIGPIQEAQPRDEVQRPYRGAVRPEPTPYALPADPRPETEVEGARTRHSQSAQTPTDLARCDNQPLAMHHRALADELLTILFEAALPEDSFDALTLFEQARLLVILGAYACHCHPRRLARLVLTPGTERDAVFDEGTGEMGFLPEEALVKRLANGASHPGHEPVATGRWQVPAPEALAALIRRHLAAVRAAFAPALPPTAAVFWAANGGRCPRPLAYTDFVDWLASLRPRNGLTIRPGDILRFGEARAYRLESDVCPAALYWIAGTYSPRLRVVSSYLALTRADRATAARRQLAALPGLIATRPRGWPASGGTGQPIAERLEYILDGAVGAPSSAPTEPSERCGTPRHLALDYVASVYARLRREAWPLGTATTAALARRAAGGLRIFAALRRTEMRLLRRDDVIGIATGQLSLVVQGKPGGDGRIRPIEIPLAGEPARALRHYLQRAAPRDDGKLFDPAITDEILALLPHGIRATLASFAVSRYQADAPPGARRETSATWYRWTPRDWLIVHAMLGHEIPDQPIGQDDDTTHAEMRRTIQSLTAALHDELVARADKAREVPRPDRRIPSRDDRTIASTGALAPPCSPLTMAFLERIGQQARQAHPRIVDYVAGRLERVNWPENQDERLRRIEGWYREAIIIEGERLGRTSWRIMAILGEILVEAGVLNDPPLLARRGLREIAGPTLDLVGLADPTGMNLRDALRADLVGGSASLAPVAGMLLLLDCAWPDAIRALSEARWSDVRWRARIIRVPSGVATLADDPLHDRAIAFGPDTELALIALMRHGETDGGYILRPPDAPAMAPAQIGDMLRREWRRRTGRNASSRLISAVASRHQRQRLDGATVSLAYEGGLARPILDWDPAPLEAHIATGFTPVSERDMAPLRGRPSSTTWSTGEGWLVTLGADVRVRLSPPSTSPGDLAAWFGARAGELIATSGGANTDHDAGEILARSMLDATDGESARRANAAVALTYLATRITGGKRDKVGRETGGKMLAPNTLIGYWTDLALLLRRIGATPLNRWSVQEWRAIEAIGLSASRMRRLSVVLGQLRDVALAAGIPLREGWTLAAPMTAMPIPMLTPRQIEGVAQHLRDRGGDMAADLLRLFGIQLRHWLRIGEATALLLRDVFATACWVDARHTKDREGRLVPRSSTFEGFEEALREYLATTLSGVGPGALEPPYLQMLADPSKLDTLTRRYRRILAAVGVWPHLLRHQGGTIYATAARTARGAGRGEVPGWASEAAEDLNITRALAAYYGHSTTTYTMGTYDQSLYLRIRQANTDSGTELGTRAITSTALRQLLRIGDARMAQLIREVGGNERAQPELLTALRCARLLIRSP